MKRYIKRIEKDEILVFNLNVSKGVCKVRRYCSSFPDSCTEWAFFEERPGDFLHYFRYSSDDELFKDFFSCDSCVAPHSSVYYFRRNPFFGKNGRKLSAYWNLR